MWVQKCFFPLKSNSTIGYLVAPATQHRASSSQVLKAMYVSYDYAVYLQDKYKIEHFLLSNIMKLTILTDHASHLNLNLWNEDFDKMYKKEQEHYPEGSMLFVQKAKTAPEPHLLLGCLPDKLLNFKKALKRILGECL
jgi:hypothetical protein